MKKTFLSMLLLGSSCALFAQVEQTTGDSLSRNNATNQNAANQNNWNNNQNSMNQGNQNNATGQYNNGSTPDDKTTLASSGQYAAYSTAVSVPSSIQTQFTTANPGATDVRWEQNNQWYRATYKVGAHRMRMMYDMRGNNWAIALPVTSGLIPDEVIERAYTLYGDNVYDITRLKTAPKAMTSNTTTTTTTGTDATMNNSTTGTTGNTGMDNSMNNGTGMSTSTLNVGGEIYQVRIIENGVLRTERMNEDGTPYTEAYWRVDSVDVNNMNNQNMNQQNWNNNNQNMNQQQTTTDSSQSGGGQGSMNMNNSSNNNSSTNSTDNTNNQAPASPSDNGSSSTPNTDATMPSSEPRLQK